VAGGAATAKLCPVFAEWFMGLPPGWVTDPGLGLTPNEQIAALGNGVVPLQAAAAIRALAQLLQDRARL
jgi:DNA (cytosine-5)-methyltransferase 1